MYPIPYWQLENLKSDTAIASAKLQKAFDDEVERRQVCQEQIRRVTSRSEKVENRWKQAEQKAVAYDAQLEELQARASVYPCVHFVSC